MQPYEHDPPQPEHSPEQEPVQLLAQELAHTAEQESVQVFQHSPVQFESQALPHPVAQTVPQLPEQVPVQLLEHAAMQTAAQSLVHPPLQSEHAIFHTPVRPRRLWPGTKRLRQRT